MKKIIIILIILFNCTGCYNYREINDLAIVSGIGIEKNNNKYLITTQIINIKKGNSENNSSTNSKIVVYKGTGKTIEEALNNITNKSSKNMFYHHLKILIIDKDVLKKELNSTIDFLARNTDIGLNFQVLTSNKNKPKEILEVLTPMEDIPSNDIEKLLEINKKENGIIYSTTFEDLLNEILDEERFPVIPNIIITGNKNNYNNTKDLNKSNPNANIKVKDLIAFKKNKELILNENESIGYNLLNNNINEFKITNKCNNELSYFTINLYNTKSNYKYINNKLYINIKSDLNIDEYNCNNKTYKNKKELLNITNNNLKKYIKSTINKVRNNFDYIGIGNYMYKNNNKYYNKKTWNKDFNNMKIIIKTELKIKDKGNLKTNIIGSDIYD